MSLSVMRCPAGVLHSVTSFRPLLLTAPFLLLQVMINGHALCPPPAVARSRDPCRLGTAVLVERPQRSEDGRPGRPAVKWNRLETATAVTKCGVIADLRARLIRLIAVARLAGESRQL